MNASILLYACAIFTMASSNPFEGQKYILEEGFFNSDTLIFVESSSVNQGVHDQFQFLSNGQLKHKIYNPEKLGICGNGLLYLDTAVFTLNGNQISIQAAGGRWTMSGFQFHADYRWEKIGNRLRLVKVNTHYYEEDNPYLILENE